MDSADPGRSDLESQDRDQLATLGAPTYLWNVPVRVWFDAPDSLRILGLDLPGTPEARYVRRWHSWVIWRAGPRRGGDARYWAAHRGDATRWCTFRIFADGSGIGTNPDGETVTRLRRWRGDLRRSQ